MSRLSREKEAIQKAESVDLAWHMAKDVNSEAPKGAACDYQNILPADSSAANKIDTSSMEVGELHQTRYEKLPETVPVVQQARINGKDVTYYNTEQSNQNLLLKASVAENEELMTTMYELQAEQVGNSRELLMKRSKACSDRLREFDEGFRWPEPSGLTPVHLVSNLPLRISMDKFQLFGEVTQPSLVPIQSFLVDSLEERVTPARKQSIEGPVNDVLFGYLQDLDQSCPGVHRMWEILLRHSDLVHTDVLQYIKGELAVSGEKLKGLLNDYDRFEQEQNDATQRDDMQAADTAHKNCVATLEKVISIIRSRLSQISMGSSDTGTFQGKYLQNTDEARTMIGDLRKEKETLRTDLIADLDKLTTFGEDAAKANAELTKRHDDATNHSNALLSRLTKEQDDLWLQIEELVQSATTLGERKAQEVTNHLRKTEEEEKRKREYVEFSEVYSEHSRRIQNLIKNTDTALNLLDATEDYINKCCEIIDIKDVADELQDIKLSELNRYLSVFRKFCLKIGDLIVRRKGRLSGIQRLKRNAEAQLALCTETLDPNKHKYKNEIGQFNVAEVEVKEHVADLLQRLAQQEQDFEPSEELLEEMGVDFTPPKLEHREMEAGKRKHLLQITKDIVGKEQDEVDKEATDLRKLHTDTALGKEVAERKRETKKKLGGTSPNTAASSVPQTPALPCTLEGRDEMLSDALSPLSVSTANSQDCGQPQQQAASPPEANPAPAVPAEEEDAEVAADAPEACNTAVPEGEVPSTDPAPASPEAAVGKAAPVPDNAPEGSTVQE